MLQRYEQSHFAFTDPSINAVICLLVVAWLPALTALRLRVHQSMTILHLAFSTRSGLRNFYNRTAITESGHHLQPLPFTINHLLQDPTDTPTSPILRSLERAAQSPDFDTDSQRPRELSYRRTEHGYDPAKQKIVSSVAVYRPSSIRQEQYAGPTVFCCSKRKKKLHTLETNLWKRTTTTTAIVPARANNHSITKLHLINQRLADLQPLQVPDPLIRKKTFSRAVR